MEPFVLELDDSVEPFVLEESFDAEPVEPDSFDDVELPLAAGAASLDPPLPEPAVSDPPERLSVR